MWLYQGQSYWVRDGYVEIIGGVKLKIIGWDRRYDDYENGEARLVYRDNKMICGYLRIMRRRRTWLLIEPIDLNSLPKAFRENAHSLDILPGLFRLSLLFVVLMFIGLFSSLSL
jgi:hypothetical protein